MSINVRKNIAAVTVKILKLNIIESKTLPFALKTKSRRSMVDRVPTLLL